MNDENDPIEEKQRESQQHAPVVAYEAPPGVDTSDPVGVAGRIEEMPAADLILQELRPQRARREGRPAHRQSGAPVLCAKMFGTNYAALLAKAADVAARGAEQKAATA